MSLSDMYSVACGSHDFNEWYTTICVTSEYIIEKIWKIFMKSDEKILKSILTISPQNFNKLISYIDFLLKLNCDNMRVPAFIEEHVEKGIPKFLYIFCVEVTLKKISNLIEVRARTDQLYKHFCDKVNELTKHLSALLAKEYASCNDANLVDLINKLDYESKEQDFPSQTKVLTEQFRNFVYEMFRFSYRYSNVGGENIRLPDYSVQKVQNILVNYKQYFYRDVSCGTFDPACPFTCMIYCVVNFIRTKYNSSNKKTEHCLDYCDELTDQSKTIFKSVMLLKGRKNTFNCMY